MSAGGGPRPRVAVVGGGITGLAAAWFLRERADVTVFEGSGRLGGKILTGEFAGRPVDAGPDAFLSRAPDAVGLCRELGLAGELVGPATASASLWARGRLRPLPEGTVLGVPTSLSAVARSGVLPPQALARAALDLVLPGSPFGADKSVARVVGARLGRAVVDGLVDPLVGGIHAGRSDELSAAATVPLLAAAARRHRSLLMGLRAEKRGQPSPAGPAFLTLRPGLGRLVEGLATGLADVRRQHVVTSLEPGVEVPGTGGPSRLWSVAGLPYDGVVLALPAPGAARLLQPHCSAAAAELRTIRHASVVVTTLAYPASALRSPLTGSGFLVPRTQGALLTACTFASNKWPHWAAPGSVVLRVSAGRSGDDRALQLDDGPLVDRLQAELVRTLGLDARPTEARVSRWIDGFPQYDVGHLDRVARIEAALSSSLPGVVVAGSAYRGLGIPACIASASVATGRLLEQLGRLG